MGTEHDGASVDLVLTNTSDYVGDTGSTKVNGKYGKLGNINLQVNNKVNISFKFVNAQDQPVTLPCFYFSVFDIDRAGKKKSGKRASLRTESRTKMFGFLKTAI